MNPRVEKILSGLSVQVFSNAMKVLPMRPPMVFAGENSSIELANSIAHKGVRKIIVITDKIIVELGLLKGMLGTFDDRGIEYIVFDGVEPDPTFAVVEEGVRICKRNDCEAILAFGGGSSIDAAKAVAALATNNTRIEKLAGLFRVRKKALPLYAVPTTAGTGSEVTMAAIITNSKLKKKMQVLDPKLLPLEVALDPLLMLGLPPAITAAAGMDALTHAIESFLSLWANPETKTNSESAIRLIFQYLLQAYNEGSNVEARDGMAKGSFYAGLAFTKTNVGYVHAIAHNIGARYHVPHGLANAIALPYVLEFYKEEIAAQLAYLAESVGVADRTKSDSYNADQFINEIKTLLREMEIPGYYEDLTREDVPSVARAALAEARFWYPVPKLMNQGECEALLYKMVSA